ncbi:hypothetical protein TNCV_4929691 [Trichonephila clavipes]|nr:hypothetical protein TNCV_4929691 [Trichonephila clavipes]
MEQKTNLKFCFNKNGNLEMLRSEHGEETLSHKTVFQWFKRFREERKSYSNVMECLLARIHRVRSYLAASGKWFLLHNNARTPLAMCIRRLLTQQQLFHLPYSTDPAPADFFPLFPTEIGIKGTSIS